MIERILLAALLWLTALSGLWLLRRRSPLNPMVVALGMTALVGSLYPLASLFVSARTWRSSGDAAVELVRAVQLDYWLYCAGLLVAYLAFGSRRPLAEAPATAHPPRDAWLRLRDNAVPLALVVVGLSLYLVYVREVGLDTLLNRANYAEKYRASTGLGPLTLGLHLAFVGCLWAEASHHATRGAKVCFRAVALALGVWSLAFLSVRANVAILGVGYACIWLRRRDVQLRRIRPGVVLVVLCAWAGLELFAVLRAAVQHDPSRALSTLAQLDLVQEETLGVLLGGSELAHPFYTSMELAEVETPAELLGASYANAFLVLLPLALHPERPSTLSQDFARQHYPALADRGGGTGFSFVGEAWWNLGPGVGPALLGLACGLALAAWDRARRRRPWGLLSALTPYLLFHVCMLHRYEFAALLKHVLAVGLPVCVLLCALALLWRATGRAFGHRRTHISLEAHASAGEAL